MLADAGASGRRAIARRPPSAPDPHLRVCAPDARGTSSSAKRHRSEASDPHVGVFAVNNDLVQKAEQKLREWRFRAQLWYAVSYGLGALSTAPVTTGAA